MTPDEIASLRLLPDTAERWARQPDNIATVAVASCPTIHIAAAALLYQEGAHTIVAIRPESEPNGAPYRHRAIATSHNAGIPRLNRQAAAVAAMLDTDTSRWPIIYQHPGDYAANKRVKPKTRRRFEQACAQRAAS